MTNIRGLFLILLFATGAILVPAFHRVHCEDHLAAGSDTHCLVCQVAATPCIAPLPINAIISDKIVVDSIQFECAIFVAASIRTSSQARAPPAG